MHTKNISVLVVLESYSINHNRLLFREGWYAQIRNTRSTMPNSHTKAMNYPVCRSVWYGGNRPKHNIVPQVKRKEGFWRQLRGRSKTRRERNPKCASNVKQIMFPLIISCAGGCLHLLSTTEHQLYILRVCSLKVRSLEAGEYTSVACKKDHLKQNVHRYFTPFQILHINVKCTN